MARRSALPDGAGSIPAATGKRCGPCEANNPSRYLCPTCPRRATQQSDDDHGWGRARVTYQGHVVDACYENAVVARNLALTHEKHPAYHQLLAEYQRTGDILDAVRRSPRP